MLLIPVCLGFPVQCDGLIPEAIYIDGNGIEWTDNIVQVNLKAAVNTDAAERLIAVFGHKLGTSEIISFAIDQPAQRWRGMEQTHKAYGVVEALNKGSDFVSVTVAIRGALETSPPRPVEGEPR